MALLVNWFEVRFDRKTFNLPYVDSPTWEDSTNLLHAYPDAQIARVRLESNEVRAYFVTGNPQPNGRAEISVFGIQNLSARIVEYNFARHLELAGAEVTRGRWGVDAIRTVQRFEQIGLVLKQGANIKYFAVIDPQTRNGVTLNWIVRPVFERSLAELPRIHKYDGYPVILKWPASAGDCPQTIAPFNQRYLGTILGQSGKDAFSVLVRNRTQQDVRADTLFLEARTDVISALEPIVTKASGQQSIQRRILQLSHALRPDGRRNPGILRDQLHSALKAIDPSGRGEVAIALSPNCAGTMWLNCYATGVRPE
jgi:hypothetical protein